MPQYVRIRFPKMSFLTIYAQKDIGNAINPLRKVTTDHPSDTEFDTDHLLQRSFFNMCFGLLVLLSKSASTG